MGKNLAYYARSYQDDNALIYEVLEFARLDYLHTGTEAAAQRVEDVQYDIAHNGYKIFNQATYRPYFARALDYLLFVWDDRDMESVEVRQWLYEMHVDAVWHAQELIQSIRK